MTKRITMAQLERKLDGVTDVQTRRDIAAAHDLDHGATCRQCSESAHRACCGLPSEDCKTGNAIHDALQREVVQVECGFETIHETYEDVQARLASAS